MADVAQLVEPRIVVPVVAGSSPVVRPYEQDDLVYPESSFFYIRIFVYDFLQILCKWQKRL